ncbi:EF-hand domain-containing protein [Kiloniella sp.]|uniref:EF-hand domain-containing protein n=1 Tax=Kiloniella sp. TaxID=1938587 RepID=UPI003B024425
MKPVKVIAFTVLIGFSAVIGLFFYLSPDATPPLLKEAGYETRQPLTPQELELEAKIPAPILIRGFNRITFKEQYIARLVLPLRKLGRHHKFIDQKVIIEIDSKEILKYRDRRQKYYSKKDTNKDGSITEEELLTLIPDRLKQLNLNKSEKKKLTRIKAEIEKILNADTNGDRTIDPEEIRIASQNYALKKPLTTTRRIAELLTLDPNKDGKLTFTELANLGVEAFDYYDDNGDAVVGPDEFKRVRTAKGIAAKRKYQHEQQKKYLARVQSCELPQPGDLDKIYVIGAREGSAISTVSVSGQDRETTTGTIEIEPGAGKIYIYATTFEGMIWQVK